MVRNVHHRVELPEDLDRFVRDEVAAGRFSDFNHALTAGLERLREDRAGEERLRESIEQGVADAESGRLADGDAAFARIRERLRAKHGDAL